MNGQARNARDIRNSLSTSGELFEDTEFPAVDQTIFYSHALPKKFEWKRPHVSFSFFIPFFMHFFIPFFVYLGSILSIDTTLHHIAIVNLYIPSMIAFMHSVFHLYFMGILSKPCIYI